MPAPGQTRVTHDRVIDAVLKNFGMVRGVAEELGVSTETVRRYRKQWPDVADAFSLAREGMTDSVELELYNSCMNGDVRAMKLWLEAHGKRRGYMDRTEVDRIVDEEIAAIATVLEEGLEPHEWRKVAGLLAKRVG